MSSRSAKTIIRCSRVAGMPSGRRQFSCETKWKLTVEFNLQGKSSFCLPFSGNRRSQRSGSVTDYFNRPDAVLYSAVMSHSPLWRRPQTCESLCCPAASSARADELPKWCRYPTGATLTGESTVQMHVTMGKTVNQHEGILTIIWTSPSSSSVPLGPAT